MRPKPLMGNFTCWACDPGWHNADEHRPVSSPSFHQCQCLSSSLSLVRLVVLVATRRLPNNLEWSSVAHKCQSSRVLRPGPQVPGTMPVSMPAIAVYDTHCQTSSRVASQLDKYIWRRSLWLGLVCTFPNSHPSVVLSLILEYCYPILSGCRSS